MTAGNFLPTSRNCGEFLSYAVGAPRANGTGQVVLFVKCHSELLKVQLVLNGDNFASQFGYSLASADVNNDGLADLFVGAPFYHAEGSGGAVYYYSNSAGGLDSSTAPILLTGGSRESRFGFALSSAGDTDNDGYEDLAVGAPYHGNGAVFLYQGGPAGLRTRPSQVILAEDIPGPPLATLGYSLSGGLDMDLNNHTDLLVGAYESDAIVILRSRPVIDIVTWFGNKTVRINPSKLGCDMDPTSEEVCFEVESCFQIRNFPVNIETTIVKYKIISEVFGGGKKISRVRFSSSSGEVVHSNEKIVQVRKNNLDGCFRELVYLKEGTADLRSPIKFLVEYSLGLDEPSVQGGRIPNINQFPILNRHEASKELEIPFYKDCGSDDICQSALSAEVRLSFQGEEDLTSTVLELGEDREILLNLTVSNTGDPAYFAWLHLNFSSVFSYVGRSDTVTDILCELQEETSLRCNLGNPFLQRTETLQFKLVPLYSASLPSDVMFTTNISTDSDNVAAPPTESRQFQLVRRAEVSVRGLVLPEAVLYGGTVVGESAVREVGEIGQKLSHTFHVVNEGPWPAEEVTLHIDWPYQAEGGAEQGKWLQYLTEAVELSPPGIGRCFLSPKRVNSLGLRERRPPPSLSPPHLSRRPNRLPGVPTKLREEVREKSSYSSKFFSSSSSSSSSSYSSKVIRTRRSAVDRPIQPDYVVSEQVHSQPHPRCTVLLCPPISSHVLTCVAQGGVERVVVFDCGRGTAKCFTISCRFPKLVRETTTLRYILVRNDWPHITDSEQSWPQLSDIRQQLASYICNSEQQLASNN